MSDDVYSEFQLLDEIHEENEDDDDDDNDEGNS